MIFKNTKYWPQEKVGAVSRALSEYDCVSPDGSVAVNYCRVATGEFDGYICLAKDSFPHFAGALILREAGGKATNLNGDSDLNSEDRVFVGANIETYPEVMRVLDRLPGSVLEYK